MSITSIVVWVWMVLATFGLAFAGWTTVDALLDRAAQRKARINGLNAAIVKRLIRSAIASIVLQGFFWLLGLGALLAPQPPASGTFFFYAAGYFAVAGANIYALGANQIDKTRMRGWYRQKKK